MAWIRLSDTYIDHPKFLALSASAFRLWHEGIAFCRKHQTDGLISMSELQGFRYHQTARAVELAKPHRTGEAPLWEPIDGFGYKVHDYLDWNPSKDEENERRAEAKDRMKAARDRRQSPGIPPSSQHVRTHAVANVQRSSRAVPEKFARSSKQGMEEEALKKREEDATRAGNLVENYREWYSRHRRGAKLVLMGNTLEWDAALVLVQTWDDERLEKLAQIVLTTDDDWISRTDRSFFIFSKKAAWADDRLTSAESGAA